MEPSKVVLSLVVAFSNVLLVVGAPASSTWFSNGIVNGHSVGSPSFHIMTSMITEDENECSHTVKVVGQGIEDTFDLDCDANNNVTSISSDKYALYENPSKGLSLFTETPSTLVVIKHGKCSKRSYQTSEGKTTHSETSMDTKDCDLIKEEIEVKKEENKKYWEQWQTDFYEKMRKSFPPCFPFCNKDGSSSQEKDTSESKEISSEEITETDKTSPEYWRQWQQKFDEKMRKKFPPCFPFCNKKKPIKPDQDDEEKNNSQQGEHQSSGSDEASKNEDDIDEEVSWNF